MTVRYAAFDAPNYRWPLAHVPRRIAGILSVATVEGSVDDAASTLDFGVMCEGLVFPDWISECLRHLLEIDGVDLRLLVIDSSDGDNQGGGSISSKLTNLSEYRRRTNTRDALNKAFWFGYQHVPDDPPCRDPVDWSEELDSVPRLTCSGLEDGFARRFRESDLDRMREFDLDFVLRFAFGIIRGEVLDVPRYGVWSFHHNDERKYRGAQPCLPEIYEGDPVTGAILQRLTDRLDGGVVLKRGFFPTQDTWESNLNNVFYGSAEWPAQVAIDILNGEADYLDDPPTTTDATIYRSPSPWQMTKYNLLRGRAALEELFSGTANWNVGIVPEPIQRFSEDVSAEIDWFPRSRNDGFLADPFAVTIDGQEYIFVEDFDYADCQADIAYIEFPDGFDDGVFHTAHKEPFHVSYPYVFEHEGDVFATPETSEANEIRLYRIHEPDHWSLEQTLVEIGGLAPTIYRSQDRWWLFFNEPEYDSTKLHLWYSSELTGEWTPHANNPVKTDVRSSRPAGTPFQVQGDLYRPAQYRARGFGEWIVLNKVTDLTPTRFREVPVGEIVPRDGEPYSSGRHTVSSGDGFTLVDGKRTIRDGTALERKLHRWGFTLGE